MISVVLLVCLYFCINGGRKRNEEGAELTAVVRPGNNEANSTSQENLDNEKHPEGQRGGSTM